MPPEAKPTGLEKPKEPKKPGDEPVIHVIPEKFYGAGLKMKAPAPALTPAAPVPPSGTPSIVRPPAAAKKGPNRLVLFGAAVILLAAIGAGAYMLTKPPASAPAPIVNSTPIVQKPVCGDAKCDAPTETSANCPADCPLPVPVCGDAKCDAPTETTDTCPTDCKPPVPACGDGKCDAPAETSTSCPADCTPPAPKPGVDTDSDGLSDVEEKTVFGTNPANPNSDGDSYVDLKEVLNLYDPAKPTPALLKDNPLITAYVNAADGYTLLRPAAWTVKEAAQAGDATKFSAPTGEFVSVLAVDKPATQGIMEWYLAQAPGVTSSQVEPYKTKMGHDAVLSPDRMTAYVDLGTKVVVVTYDLGGQPFVEYRVTFQMMVTSIAALPAPTTAPTAKK